MQGCGCRGQYSCCTIYGVHYAMCQSMWKGFKDVWRSVEFSMQGHTLTLCANCHGMTSLPLLCPPLATSNPIHLHSTSSTSTLLQLQCTLAQLVQLHHTHSQTNCGSIPDPFGPGSHAKGHHLYTLSTFVLFA